MAGFLDGEEGGDISLLGGIWAFYLGSIIKNIPDCEQFRPRKGRDPMLLVVIINAPGLVFICGRTLTIVTVTCGFVSLVNPVASDSHLVYSSSGYVQELNYQAS
jgi:hypothetical protein